MLAFLWFCDDPSLQPRAPGYCVLHGASTNAHERSPLCDSKPASPVIFPPFQVRDRPLAFEAANDPDAGLAFQIEDAVRILCGFVLLYQERLQLRCCGWHSPDSTSLLELCIHFLYCDMYGVCRVVVMSSWR